LFRVLKKPPFLQLDKATTVTLSWVYLRNILRRAPSRLLYCPPGTFDSEGKDTRQLIPGLRTGEQSDLKYLLSLIIITRKSPRSAQEILSEYSDLYITHEGRFSLQVRY
jgi:hypothetical protein